MIDCVTNPDFFHDARSGMQWTVVIIGLHNQKEMGPGERMFASYLGEFSRHGSSVKDPHGGIAILYCTQLFISFHCYSSPLLSSFPFL